MSFFYLASPYSRFPGGIDLAFSAACDVAAALIKLGYNVYSPIAHSHSIAAKGIDPRDRAIWLALDAPMMRAADALIVARLPGWETSAGINDEVEAFRAQDKPIDWLLWPECKFVLGLFEPQRSFTEYARIAWDRP